LFFHIYRARLLIVVAGSASDEAMTAGSSLLYLVFPELSS